MPIINVYTGQLFKGNPAIKGWDPLASGPVELTIEPVAGKWMLVAHKEEDKIWEVVVDPTFKCRQRDNFIQWSLVSGPKKELFGIRLKELSQAQQLYRELTSTLSQPVPSNERMLRIRLPSKELLTISCKLEMTMLQLMKEVTTLKQLDPIASFALALGVASNDSPHFIKPSLTVRELSSTLLTVWRRKKSVQEKPKITSAVVVESHSATLSIEVTIPSNEKRSFSVNGSILLPDLVLLVCETTGLNPDRHEFDLPIQNHARIKLQQLRLTQLILIEKEMPIDTKKAAIDNTCVESTDSGSIDNSHKYTLKKRAPLPPSSPSSKRGTSPIVQSHVRLRSSSSPMVPAKQDVNDVISSMLTQQAMGKALPTKAKVQLSPLIVKRSAPDPPGKIKRSAPPPPSSKQDKEMTDHPQPDTSRHIPRLGIALPSMVKNNLSSDTSKGKTFSISPSIGRRQSREKPPLEVELSPQPMRRTGSVDRPCLQKEASPVTNRHSRKAPSKPAPYQSPRIGRSAPEPVKNKPAATHKPVPEPATHKPAPEPATHKPAPEPARHKPAVPVPYTIPKPPDTLVTPSVVTNTALGKPLVFKIPPPPPPKKTPPQPVTDTATPTITEPITREEEKREEEEKGEEEESEEENSDSERTSVTSEDTSSSARGYDIENDIESDSSPDEEEQVEEVDADTSKMWQESSHQHKLKPDESADSSSSSEEEEEEEGEGNGEIVLLRHEPVDGSEVEALLYIPSPPLEAELTDPAIEEAVHQLTHIEPANTTVDEHNMSSNFKELDNMVASLRTLIADTCEITGTDVTSPTTDDKPFDFAHLKEMAPPLDNQVSSPVATPSETSTATPSQFPAPPPIPPQKKPPPPLIKPKPKPKPNKETGTNSTIRNESESKIEDELKLKLQERQEKIKEVSKKREEEEVGKNDYQPPVSDTVPVKTDTYPTTNGGGGGGGDMQSQLQMLQQQMMQQQMMQLQQQFQQLQQQMMVSAGGGGGGQPQFNPLQYMMGQYPMTSYPHMMTTTPPHMMTTTGAMVSSIPPNTSIPIANAAMLVAPPTLPSIPVAPPTIPSIPVAPPTIPYVPIAPPTIPAMPVAPPTLSSVPITAPTLSSVPIVPPTLSSVPVAPPTLSSVPVAPPTLSSVPVAPPTLSSVPVAPPTLSSVPVVPPTLSSVPVVPPTLSSVPVAPPAMPVASQQATPPHSSEEVPSSESTIIRKVSEADRRSVALGTIEDTFDNLMEEMKEVKPEDILMKVPEDDLNLLPESAYTGMTAALIEAMKERRQHFSTEGSFITDPSEDDTTVEWEEEDL